MAPSASSGEGRDRDDGPGVLAPPGAFTDMRSTADDRARFGMSTPPEQTGPASGTVAQRITKNCASRENGGKKKRPLRGVGPAMLSLAGCEKHSA